MIGQGRPVIRHDNLTRGLRGHFNPARAIVCCCALVAVVCLSAPMANAAPSTLLDQPIRLRVAWGGREAVRWTGSIALDKGTLADPQLLGTEADAAATVSLETNQLKVNTPRPHLFDGVDVTVTATSESRLTIEMKSAPDAAPIKVELPLTDALHKPYHLRLDDRGSELVIQRAPNDGLRIITHRDSLIFSPGEQFTFDVQPVLDEIEPGTTIDIEAKLTVGRGGSPVWDNDQKLPVPINGPPVATLHVPLPQDEGVYQFHVAVTRPAGFRPWAVLGGANKPLVERTFQVVVLSAMQTRPALDGRWQPVLEIDPAGPRWWERLPEWTQVRRIPGLSQRPLGSTRANAVSDALGSFVELPSTVAGSEPNWQAYPLPVEADGAPHMLEIEYPNDQEQHLGISILEPNAAGKLVPVSRDSGVYVEGHGHAEQIEKHKHRLVFWPRTNAPLLLVTNLHPTASGRFGHIRVLKRTNGTIAADAQPTARSTDRLLAAYIARPLLPETFGASEGLDTTNGQNQSVDDWKTFYDSATRLADYVSFAGYNTAAVSVLADGSAIFPSTRLLSTPRHNTSLMVAGTTDLPSTDALELMFRVFDRNQLALVPTLQLAAPLPELEALRKNADPRQSGLELVGPNGATWQETRGSDGGLAPYYNLLDERVQEAILNVVHELADRYGRHPAFAGLAVQLSGNGYAILPGLDWGLDDATVARFQRDTGIQVADQGENRFALRQASLTGEHAEAWRTWRAAQITSFYLTLARTVQAGDDKRRLILTTEDLFSSPEIVAQMQPAVTSKLHIDRMMLELGIDRGALSEAAGIVVLPTRYVESMTPLADRAVDVEINDALGTELPRAPLAQAAVMFYHRPERRRLATKSPLEANTFLACQTLADGAAARQPYAAMLRNDVPEVIFDGGELLPLGQEDATRRVRQILQSLPTGNSPAVQSDGCVTLRSTTDGTDTIYTIVNQCPWHVDATVGLELPAAMRMEPVLTDAAAEAPSARSFASGSQTWSLKLAPYDVQAVRFSGADMKVESLHTSISPDGQRELQSRLTDLRNRDLTATHMYTALNNPGFEPIGGGSPTPGWQLVGNPSQSAAELDATRPKEGKTCLYLQNRATSGTTVVQSDSFTTPPTGQLAMAVYLRGNELSPTSELRMVFETERAGRVYRRFATIGGLRAGTQHLTKDWQYLAFGVNDLPLDSHGRMQIKFELTGAGEIWFDQVQLYDVLFPLQFYDRSQPERLELEKLRRSVESALETNQIADCQQLLDGYWSRFLLAYTPPVQPMIAVKPPAATSKPQEGQGENSPPTDKPDDSPTLGDRLKHYVPSVLRR